MKKKSIIIIEKPVELDLLSPSQACNHFQIVGIIRTHVLNKFKGQKKSKKDWEVTFKEERVN